MASNNDPTQTIKETVEKILSILQSEKNTKWVEKRDEISKIIHTHFDFEEQARRVLTKNWKKACPAEREKFIALFSKLQEQVYLNRLKNYSSVEVDFTKCIIKLNKAKVFSIIKTSHNEISINYSLKERQGKWLVYDVVIEGVSLVQNYRKQFAQILKKEKYAGLFQIMEERIRQNKETEGQVQS